MQRLLTILLLFTSFAQTNTTNHPEKLILKPYGYIKLDMSYDSDLMSIGNFARWVLPKYSESIPITSITANQSRFGVDLKKDAISGKLEIDFYGLAGAENKAGLLLRKAYIQADFDNFSIRAGQDSDVISPLVPSTINYPVAWWAGNIGYRRPMLKIFGKGENFDWTFALARNIGGDIHYFGEGGSENDGLDDGAAAIIPELQGRLGFTVMDNYTVGFSGHFAQRDIGSWYRSDNNYSSWSANIDLNLQVTPKISLSGEAFVGSNLAGILGGIANTSTFKGVETQGGWINLKYKPTERLSISTGASIDDPQDGDLQKGMRSKNSMYFANFYYDILQGFLVGLEISHWQTEYNGFDTAEASRGQLAFLYNF